MKPPARRGCPFGAADALAEPPPEAIAPADGTGISPANAARIFDPFFTTARDRGGTGLGLTIARSLLAAHGGSIDLVPSAEGAAFEITLPLV